MTLNVVGSAAPIKGAGAINRGDLSLEQLIGGGAMLLNPVDMRLDPRDFALQRLDPLVELVDRDRVEILLDQLG